MINAYNMMDGIDGLAGGLGVISAISLYLLIGHNIADGARNILLLLIGSLTAYLILNLHLLPKWTSKIFMGDAGSMVLGFILTAFTIRYSQGHKENFYPITAVWIVSVPLMDIFATSIRRLRHGKNPFHPDRTHIHHILMRAGFSSNTALLVILGSQALLAMIGILIQKSGGSELVSLLAFMCAFFVYLLCISYAFRISKWVRSHVTKANSVSP